MVVTFTQVHDKLFYFGMLYYFIILIFIGELGTSNSLTRKAPLTVSALSVGGEFCDYVNNLEAKAEFWAVCRQ